MHDFITSSIGHLEKIDSPSYEDLPNIDKFHSLHNIQNIYIYLLNSPPILSGKSLSAGRQSSSWWHEQDFQNSDFFFFSKLNHHNRYHQLFSLK